MKLDCTRFKLQAIALYFIMFCFCAELQAKEIGQLECTRLANAIFQAEGGAHTAHPYGILQHYKHTTARQACINTIRHYYRDWNGKGDFIAYLGSYYCPIGAKNDPIGLNRNWVKNVSYFYDKNQHQNCVQ